MDTAYPYLHGLNLPIFSPSNYCKLSSTRHNKIVVIDNLFGFDDNYRNQWLDQINNTIEIVHEQFLLDKVKQQYSHITFHYDPFLHDDFYLQDKINIRKSDAYQKTTVDIQNLISCFNASGHVGRQILVSALFKMGLWNNGTCTKYFECWRDRIDGNISTLNSTEARFFRKFIIDDTGNSDLFYANCIGPPELTPTHNRIGNLVKLLPIMRSSFINLVSETVSTSSQPYFTEKFLFPIISGNLWVAYGQPMYHHYIHEAFGFKNYQLFDYTFDTITDPLKRLITLLSMIKKFQSLTKDDLMDLYLMEKNNIAFNQDHYFSGDYLHCLQKMSQ
jgi:hypothetical protein